MKFRIEHDSMGEVRVPEHMYYGAQTQRAIDNFKISQQRMPKAIITAIAKIKYAAVRANEDLGMLTETQSAAIQNAAKSIMEGKLDDQFPIDVYQTGSGTSTNMNVNEVIAFVASRESDLTIHPNDHVNMCQSSNDVFPSAIRVASVTLLESELLPALQHLHDSILSKAKSLAGIVKTGRTHLMDAMPLTFEQELTGWATQIRNGVLRLQSSIEGLRALPLGGTAVGTGINAHPKFSEKAIDELSSITGIQFAKVDNCFEAISSQDSSLELSGQLKTVAVSLLKICNDLRWMNSGPQSGLAEIELAALQPGSSIMPGKVNPVIPEAVAMAAVQVIGFDSANTVAAQSGNFQLNVMLPLIAVNCIEAIRLLTKGSIALADQAIKSFAVNETQLRDALALNPILVTSLNPIIGYQKAAEIAKRAYRESKPVLELALEMTDIPKEKLEELLNPLRLTKGGIN